VGIRHANTQQTLGKRFTLPPPPLFFSFFSLFLFFLLYVIGSYLQKLRGENPGNMGPECAESDKEGFGRWLGAVVGDIAEQRDHRSGILGIHERVNRLVNRQVTERRHHRRRVGLLRCKVVLPRSPQRKKKKRKKKERKENMQEKKSRGRGRTTARTARKI
jgi:hypothetical protein